MDGPPWSGRSEVPRRRVGVLPPEVVPVFRIPQGWYEECDRTRDEILHKLGFVKMPGGGWACDDETATRVVDTVCAHSFGWVEAP